MFVNNSISYDLALAFFIIIISIEQLFNQGSHTETKFCLHSAIIIV